MTIRGGKRGQKKFSAQTGEKILLVELNQSLDVKGGGGGESASVEGTIQKRGGGGGGGLLRCQNSITISKRVTEWELPGSKFMQAQQCLRCKVRKIRGKDKKLRRRTSKEGHGGNVKSDDRGRSFLESHFKAND